MTLLQVLPWLTQRQISAAAHRLSGQSETLVVGVCSFPVDLRANWCSTCPALFHDPRRIRIGPRGSQFYAYMLANASIMFQTGVSRAQPYGTHPLWRYDCAAGALLSGAPGRLRQRRGLSSLTMMPSTTRLPPSSASAGRRSPAMRPISPAHTGSPA